MRKRSTQPPPAPPARPGVRERYSHERPISSQKRGLRQLGGRDGKRDSADRHPHLPARPLPQHYAAMTSELKHRYKISIRKWRRHMSGVAYELVYHDGRIKRLITAPRPRSPVSAAIFIHEVGHHAIGFRRYSPRCLEEFYVWQWTFREMTARRIPITPAVLRHYHRSMHHYVRLAIRHRHDLPEHLRNFVH